MVDFPREPRIDSHELFEGVKLVEVKLKKMTSIPDSVPIWPFKQYLEAQLFKFEYKLQLEGEEDVHKADKADVLKYGILQGVVDCLKKILEELDSLYFHSMLEALERAKKEMEK